MSLPFDVLLARAQAREPHRSAMSIAHELSQRAVAARRRKRDKNNEQSRLNRGKLYATKTAWTSRYDNY